jgi:hypothetical protein
MKKPVQNSITNSIYWRDSKYCFWAVFKSTYQLIDSIQKWKGAEDSAKKVNEIWIKPVSQRLSVTCSTADGVILSSGRADPQSTPDQRWNRVIEKIAATSR